MKNRIKYYLVTYWICLITAWFGFQLIVNVSNLIERTKYFDNNFDAYVGTAMVILSLLKVISLTFNWKRMKKISFIGIAIMWVLITWFYFKSTTMNTSYVISIGMAGLCYIQLYRGDYTE